jgi:Ca2+-binding RTX toxin-like protein
MRVGGTLLAVGVGIALLLPVVTQAAATADFTLDRPVPCLAGSCRVVLHYDTSALQAPVTLEIIWDVAAKSDATPDATLTCTPAAPCTATSPTYRQAGRTGVWLHVTDTADGYDDVGSQEVVVTGDRGSAGPSRGSGSDLCLPRQPNVSCGPGNGRRTAGGGDKVPHNGWPRVTGILWKVLDSIGRKKVGGPENDELLGHHGSDRLDGGAGNDIIWGDWDPSGNNGRQRDVLAGGAGNDLIYPSHGRTVVRGGAGRDYVWAYYGRGTIDCGPGKDTARVRLNGPWKVRNCERVLHFCGHGSDGHGGCLKPGEKRQGARATAASGVATRKVKLSTR